MAAGSLVGSASASLTTTSAAAIDALDEAELELSSRAKGSLLSRRSELSAGVPLALVHPVLVHAASKAPSVCYKTLRLFAGHLNNIPIHGSEPLTLFSLTRDATLHIPSNTTPTNNNNHSSSSKMAELRAQLQDQADRQAYNRMVSSATHGQPRLLSSTKGTTSTLVYSKQDQWEADDWQQTRRELSAMLNVLLTMLAVGFAAWWMLGNVKPAPKVLACMGAALFIGLAEAFLYIRFFQRKHAASSTSQLLPKTNRGSNSANSSSAPVGIVRPPIRRTKSASSLPRYRPARTTSPLSGEARPISPNPGTYQRPVSRCSMPDQLRRCAIERHRLQQTYRLSRTASFPPLTPAGSSASMSV